ncbi:gallidermin/nisin family lantibiotic [Paenibacillus bovis]
MAEKKGMFDLDVQVLKSSEVTPQIKSKSLCTPGCNPTATLCTSCIFACA